MTRPGAPLTRPRLFDDLAVFGHTIGGPLGPNRLVDRLYVREPDRRSAHWKPLRPVFLLGRQAVLAHTRRPSP